MARESIAQRKTRCEEILLRLKKEFPNPVIALTHRNSFELLIATILSAQCTDERVNKTTPAFFEAAPTPLEMHRLGVKKIEHYIKSINFFRNKAKNIHQCCKDLVEKFNSQVPQSLEELTSLPGVGRKTANVMLGNAFNTPGLVVDTHVLRISNRLNLARQKDAVNMESELEKIVPKTHWVEYSHLLILHGRKTCKALNPKCKTCKIVDLCPSAFKKSDAWKLT